MVQRIPDDYRIDPSDPRAPSQAEWDRMTPAERACVVAMLPSEEPASLLPPEGDRHRKTKTRAVETLDDFFQRMGRKIYVSSELGVYYPGEPRFSPDLLAVVDVEPHERSSWVVLSEGKGLDLVIEVYYAGDQAKDFDENVKRYARLQIREYFIFDAGQCSLRGYRLPPTSSQNVAPAYRPVLAQGGRFPSEVLGLDLMVDGSKLRFFQATAPLLEGQELIAKLGSMLDEVLVHKAEVERRALVEAQRAATLERTLIEVQSKLAEAEAEIARLKGGS